MMMIMMILLLLQRTTNNNNHQVRFWMCETEMCSPRLPVDPLASQTVMGFYAKYQLYLVDVSEHLAVIT